MKKSVFKILKMDCPTEEQIIRMKLEPIDDVKMLNVDISNRKLEVYHTGTAEAILAALESLQLNTTFVSTDETKSLPEIETQNKERKLLWTVLIINISFFVIEIATGFIANSMGLLADSLDMLADGIVYGLALFAVGGTIVRKKNIARFAGYFQVFLAILGFVEVVRRFVGLAEMPDHLIMIFISVLALIANIICLFLLQKNKSTEAHMQASMIFTSNDVIINGGVIVAGLLVYWLNSSFPDLIIGALVFAVVIRGAIRILKLSKK